jgi:hypothetical protein
MALAAASPLRKGIANWRSNSGFFTAGPYENRLLLGGYLDKQDVTNRFQQRRAFSENLALFPVFHGR